MTSQLHCALLLLTASLAAQTTSPPTAPGSFRIAGVVVDSVSKAPVANARVTVLASENSDVSQRATAGPDGRFVFSGLTAGKYTLLASAPGYRSQGFHQHENYFVGISVGPDLDSEHIVFPLVLDARIEGAVTDEDGEPIRNANVQLYQRNHDTGKLLTRLVRGTNTDDRGHYLFSHLGPGTYYIAVSARPWYAQYQQTNGPVPEAKVAERIAEERTQLDVAYPLTFHPSAEDSSGATAITLHPGDRVTADVSMRAEPAVHLRVKSAETEGATPGSMTVHGFPRISQRVFEGILVPVLAFQGMGATGGVVEYTGIATGHYVLAMPGSGGKHGNGWYKEMDLSGTVELDASENPPLASVSGTLRVEGANRPPGHIYVVLSNRTSAETFAAEVTPKGTFDFSDMEVRPGTYDVVLNVAQGYQLTAIAASGARVNGQSLVVSGGSVQLALTASGALARINGTVQEGDSPHPGAMVVLVPRDPVSNFMLFRRDESDSDGTFSLRDVLPGSYTVIALRDGWEVDWANPATLQPYLKNGVPVEISGQTKLSVKVPLQ